MAIFKRDTTGSYYNKPEVQQYSFKWYYSFIGIGLNKDLTSYDTVKLANKDHPTDQQNAVLICRCSLYASSIT